MEISTIHWSGLWGRGTSMLTRKPSAIADFLAHVLDSPLSLVYLTITGREVMRCVSAPH
ncbi:hypothetical protein SAMN02745746_01200 [Pseudogulbenkiania subflava DSM 22618]|uniref:Uncharacterized protein n=1 Tax=Pseudogulbenkiania subflava DSM 22618 TaxID=1123014 RepID=A0A1Y6BFI8_9NEIS|nr:hypothetical protein SAMN02745746_01200 [Pseudogulbenkiania subflava DSM 22618]